MRNWLFLIGLLHSISILAAEPSAFEQHVCRIYDDNYSFVGQVFQASFDERQGVKVWALFAKEGTSGGREYGKYMQKFSNYKVRHPGSDVQLRRTFKQTGLSISCTDNVFELSSGYDKTIKKYFLQGSYCKALVGTEDGLDTFAGEVISFTTGYGSGVCRP